MAVSGRKSPDFSGSLSFGSDMDHICGPCLTTGQEVDAHKYCVDCEEYLCRTCSDCHLKTKASRNHQLVDKDKDGKQPTTQDPEVCTEECPEHKQEVIKYFCPQHEALGCHVCMIMYHKTCEVDYIPDKCADVAKSGEYRKTMHSLDLKLQELYEITKTTKEIDEEIDKRQHTLLQEIIKFRKEINDYLDQLQQKIQKEADKKKSEDKQITKTILDGCNRLSSDIKKMQSTLQTYETAGKFGQLYITVKQALSVLKSDEIKAEDGFERTARQYLFERNNSLLNMLSNQDAFGKLSLTSVLRTPRKNMKTFHKLNIKEDINVRTMYDTDACWITGCGVLSSDKLVLADHNNNKLKLVNMQTKPVVEEITLDSEPWDVAVLSQDKIAVTMPKKREVVLLKWSDRQSTFRTISVTGQCYGITHHYGQLYVVCVKPLYVLILDKQGNVRSKISLNKEILCNPRYIEVIENPKLLYISDRYNNCVVSVTLKGEVTAVYNHEDFRGQGGMLSLDDGSLLVCCNHSVIHHISGDTKQCQKVTGGLRNPYSICYNHHLHEVYIGSFSCDQLKVFTPQ